MNFFTFLSVGSLLLFPLNFNPFLNLERTFAEPLYKIRSIFRNSNELPTQVKPKKDYTIVLVGDSMTAALGEDELRENLKKYYLGKEITVLNYGIGSTTIETVPTRLTDGSVKGDKTLFPAFSKNPDILLLESMGNNPINLPIEEGLKKQTETLDQIMLVLKKHPNPTVVVFVATLAPIKESYGKGLFDLTPPERKIWAEERARYIENHIEYAKQHKIPLINIYEKSKKEDGDLDIDYLDTSDFIHPSYEGVAFINREIANFIFEKRVIPL